MSTEPEINTLLSESLIRYSQVWEDYDLLIKGLAIQPDDHILSIASAGCNALAMLLEEPASVTAVDLNPAQTALCELKKAAFLNLKYEEMVELVGASPSSRRSALYQEIRGALPEEARLYFDQNGASIEQGLIGVGRLEKYFGAFVKDVVLPVATSAELEAFLRSETLEEQAKFVDAKFRDEAYKAKHVVEMGQERIANDGRDPTQFKYVENGDVGGYFYNRFVRQCSEVPVAGNFYLQYFFLGHYLDLENGPAYLRRENFDKLRDLMPRFHITRKGLDLCIADHDVGHYSKANLSDLFEYLSEAETEGFLKTLAQGMRKGGRLAYWNLLVDRHCPESLHDVLKPNEEEARALWLNDRNFFYSAFHLDEVR